MKRFRASVLLLSVLVVGCTTISDGKSKPRERPAGPQKGTTFGAEAEPNGENVPGQGLGRPAPAAPAVLSESEPETPLPVVPLLDLDHWPFGWVNDPTDAARLDLSVRFWSDQKKRWTLALNERTPFTAVRMWEQIERDSKSGEEAFRACWHLWLVYREAGLYPEARFWLDRAGGQRQGPVVALEQAWDQAFRLNDLPGARRLGTALAGPWTIADDQRKSRLLRQKMFLGTKSLSSVGADDYVSCLLVDNDDLWAGTWNGAVVRWSLTAQTTEKILSPGETVAPIKLLTATGWFLYAFQNQSLQRYSKVTGTWRSFPYPAGWTGLRVQGVVADAEESLWVAYLGQGLWHWERGRWTLVDDGGGGPFLDALSSDGQGGFWIGTKDRGLWSWKDGNWTPVGVQGEAPQDISVLQADDDDSRWIVGTWGEGVWVLSQGRLKPLSRKGDFVTGAAWSGDEPLWGSLDQGVVTVRDGERQVLGPLDGLPSGGVSSLVSWQGRWIWGTNGQGLSWWSEHENPSIFR